MIRPQHWSWSALEKFEQCPRRWRHKYIDRLPEPKSVHLERGIKVHEALEVAVQTKDAEVEFGGAWLGNIVDLYRSFKAEAEQTFNVDRNWSEVANDPDRFVPRGTYTMAKLDVLSVKDGFFADWKTGKIYAEKHQRQAELYALVLASVTGRLRWDVDLVYVDQQHREQLAFEFDDLAHVQREWDARARPLFEATEWPKKPGPLCKWCPFLKRNGGPCDGKEGDRAE